MPIPESQLSTWSNPGAVVFPTTAHTAVRTALDRFTGWPDGFSPDVFLQGSYANNTNIRSDSDVDVVVLNSTSCLPDRSRLSPAEKSLSEADRTPPPYGPEPFHADVLRALKTYFGSEQIVEGRKAVKVLPSAGRLTCDVIIAIDCNSYLTFRSRFDETHLTGIAFWDSQSLRWVINYPKYHISNGTEKNGLTSGYYKPTVRMFKNIRTYMADRRQIPGDLAPSYFVECLIYNVPNDKFVLSAQSTFCNVLNWLDGADLTSFLCQNKCQSLFGSTPEQWAIPKAQSLLAAMANLWRGWN